MGSIHLVQLTGWQDFLRQGGEFLATAVKAVRKRPDVFTPEILYNLTAMAIEKFLMAYLMHHGDLADNHTMADMIRSMERHIELPAGLSRDLLFLDSFQEICDVDTYSCRIPTEGDIEKIISIGSAVGLFVEQQLMG